MGRILCFVAMLLTVTTAGAQVPPGYPYRVNEHPNPILTFVTNQDFRPSTFADAQKLTGMELLGISKEKGRQESVEVAAIPATTRKVQLIGETYDLGFYPGGRQAFVL